MKAIVLTAYGDVDKLELRDVPEPKAGPNDVKVKMASAGINPVDWKLRSGSAKDRMPLDLPAILGRDVAGEVVEIGANVTRFKVGTRVMGLVNRGYAELVVADQDSWVEVPQTMDLVDAGSLPLVLLTGAQLVEEAIDPHENEVVLVTGALGGVGRAAIFAAKARGAFVWAGVRKARKEEAEKLDLDDVVAIDDDKDIENLPELDAIADTIGGDAIKKLMLKVRKGGVIGSVVGEPQGAKERGITVHAIMTHKDAKRLAELAAAVADGDLVIPISAKMPLAKAGEAQTMAEKRKVPGKVLLLG